MSDILPKGKTTGQACHLLLDPVKRQEELKAEREAELAKLAEKEKPGTRGKAVGDITTISEVIVSAAFVDPGVCLLILMG